MTTLIVVFAVLAIAFIGGSVLALRMMKPMPLHRFAVATRRWDLPQVNGSREDYVRRRRRIVKGGQTLPPWPWLYDVHEFDYVSIPPGTVGLVSAKLGAHAPTVRELATHVECDHFQNVSAFLARGEQGLQPELLRGGEQYAIDPEVFDVYTVANLPEEFPAEADDLRLVSIHGEDVGVVIVTDAPAPDDLRFPAPSVPGHENFQKPWVFLENGGRSGPQTDILPGGSKYAINPIFARVVHIPTRELTLTWGSKPGSEERYDSELGPLTVTIQGFDIEVHLSQTLSIPPHAAPYLVKRFGEVAQGDIGDRKSTAVQRFVGRVLGQMVAGYFVEQTSAGEIDKFIHGLAAMRAKLKVQITQALAELQVDAKQTTIFKITFGSDELNRKYREYVELEQHYKQLEQMLTNEKVTSAIRAEKLQATEKELAAKLKVLIELLGPEHVKRERLDTIDASRQQPPVILTGGGVGTIPIGPPQRVSVPAFDPDADLDVFNISPGVLPPAEAGKESGDEN